MNSLVPRAAWFGVADRREPRLSPDGTRIVYQAPRKGVINLWIANVRELDKATPLTAESRDLPALAHTGFGWCANGRHVWYMQDRNGDEQFHIHIVDTEQHVVRDGTPEPDAQAFVCGVLDSLDLVPRGISSRRPDELLIRYNQRDRRWFDVHRLNVATGELVLEERNDRFESFWCDADLQLRVASAPTDDGGRDIYYRRPGADWRTILHLPFGAERRSMPVAFGDPSGDLFYMFDGRDADTAAVVAVDGLTGATTLVGRHPKADADFLILDPEHHSPIAWSATFLRKEWSGCKGFEEAIADLGARLGDADWRLISQSAGGSTWLLRLTRNGQPEAYALFDRPSRTLTELFEVDTGVPAAAMSPVQPMLIPARDGLDLPAYLIRPRAERVRSKTAPPLILTVHGGPYSRTQWNYDYEPEWIPTQQWLADRGYAVLDVNYRCSTGFGKAFVSAGDHEIGGAAIDDLADAVRWAIAQGYGEAGRVGVMGPSMGGLATLMCLARHPDLFACGVDTVGVTDLMSFAAEMPEYWRRVFAFWHRRMGNPHTAEGRAILARNSPVTHVDRIKAPLLIGHGATDSRVKLAESEAIASALAERHHPVALVVYPDEGHRWVKASNIESFRGLTEAFFRRWLGGEAEPLAESLNRSCASVPIGRSMLDELLAEM
jgi:dipeptidyl aminopeptidase/acylaminoacyl peptidase